MLKVAKEILNNISIIESTNLTNESHDVKLYKLI